MKLFQNWLLGGLLLILWCSWANAHESRPLFIQITESSPQTYSIQWKIPPSIPDFNYPELVLAPPCRPKVAGVPTGGLIRKRIYICPEGLMEVRIRYPVLNPSVNALIQVQTKSGEKHTKLLAPDESVWKVPQRATKLQVAREYTVLGMRHIGEGWDHLLFLLGLVLIAGTGRRILITVTGFTLAHSLTLALATLDWVRLPIPPVEAVIALSIIFLATEILRGTKDSLTYRHPILVSSSFGLLHGFGFASVLQAIGLPSGDLAISLLFFNIGVEIGQLIFVLGLVVLIKIFQQITRLFWRRDVLSSNRLVQLEKVSTYGMGGLAAFWLVERVYSFWF